MQKTGGITRPNRNFWRGEKVRLRAVEQKDLEDILNIPTEPDTEIERYEDAIGFPLSPQREHDMLQNLADQAGKDDFIFCLIENSYGQVVGHINSFDCVPRNGAFKYAMAIKQPFWRQGFGRAALAILLRYFFQELRYQKCTALVYSFNEPSIRFHETMGFQFEGRLRNMVYTNGEYFDELYFGLTRAEWQQLDSPLVLNRYQAQQEAAGRR